MRTVLDTDGDGLCDAGDDCIYHEPNDPDQNSFCGTDPVLNSIGQQSTLEDIVFTLQLGSTDIDSGNPYYQDNVSYTIEDIDTITLFVSSINGSIVTISPITNNSGSGSILVTVTDDFGGSDTEVVNINIIAVPDVPNLGTASLSGTEDVSTQLNILSSLNDNDGSESLSLALIC